MRNAVGSTFEVQNAGVISLTNSTGGTGHFENFGTFIKQGAELLSVSGMLVFTNQGTIHGIGTITNSSTFTNTGILAPGLSPGILTMNGAQPLSASGTLEIELQDGSGAGTGHDQLVRSGNLTLAGTLSVTETGAVPDGLYTIILLNSGTITGNFSSVSLPPGYLIYVLAIEVILAKNVMLPLTLLSFTAQLTPDEKVSLKWLTTDEDAVSHFEVQRSEDLVRYTAITSVMATNHPRTHAYYAVDERPVSTINYYRLRMVDLDGQVRFSHIAVVKLEKDPDIAVYPTITRDRVLVETSEVITVRLLSINGILLTTQTVTGTAEINLAHLPSDIYLLCIGGTGRSIKIVKQ